MGDVTKTKRKVLRSQSREIVNRVYKYFKAEKAAGGTLCDVDKARERTCEATGVDLQLISRIAREAPDFPSPGKRRVMPSYVVNVDEFDRDVLRRAFHSLVMQRIPPTIERLREEFMRKTGWKGSVSSMRKIMLAMGFKFNRTADGRKLLMERVDVVALRTIFLREMIGVLASKPVPEIYWLDETYVHQNICVSKSWMLPGEVEYTAATGKGARLVVLLAGSKYGFVPHAELVFQSRKKGGKMVHADYHDDMNGACFTQWFKCQFLPNISPNSVIVMDNASYHNVEVEKCPTTATRKADICLWLGKHGVPFTDDMTIPMLLLLVKQHKPATRKYVIDDMAKQEGHKVIRLPPYHCIFNPIETMWAHVKRHVAVYNTKRVMSDVKRILLEAFCLKNDLWRGSVDHTMKILHQYIDREPHLQLALQNIIINLC